MTFYRSETNNHQAMSSTVIAVTSLHVSPYMRLSLSELEIACKGSFDVDVKIENNKESLM